MGWWRWWCRLCCLLFIEQTLVWSGRNTRKWLSILISEIDSHSLRNTLLPLPPKNNNIFCVFFLICNSNTQKVGSCYATFPTITILQIGERPGRFSFLLLFALVEHISISLYFYGEQRPSIILSIHGRYYRPHNRKLHP